ncbi:2-C-methyl-D-erythritol 2,4-cyclodiphosphate synthase [Garciella nitratireducens]|uniref:2-C-methyl-D-erythritol 2,4-cyclodiphosphate synthase n=1 Tax=Garciella nitratireducens DSM 15102 TaxID=1121911 RepID=A0A1T4PKL3_9FIRM|nr:2-C-methyl-D-erythritol 2,4-cyclodiphosphate synthase [Garciella nitratireducens]RBP44854.1 2-C-methyl-D-erythritol 2,4-cyclodiphosphate synthase [Garciella nitratireducens]SJZ92134.1 2-C-methyl-D-erythritol 2,4-cyclodiphosphate synthase [Garciella nitratireducens DSM 15102]
MRVGMGYDVHQLVENRQLIIGGVLIPYEKGLLGHSDADVLVHAIMDSLLGAAALGDIGKHFPDTDFKYKGVSSLKLLSDVVNKIKKKGYQIKNIDGIIVAQKPKCAPYIQKMRENLVNTMKIDLNQINIKATTTEGLGFIGKQEGVACYAVALLEEEK